MRLRFYSSVTDIPAAVWHNIAPVIGRYPFLNREFLTALEQPDQANGELAACCAKTGWQPHHAVVFQKEHAVALMPLYIKFHSYGEYIFDWAWADAYRRHGENYYPKLFSGIPFTPATGPRIAIAATNNERHAVLDTLANGLKTEAQQQRASSVHVLFSDAPSSEALETLGFIRRASFQYHWFNQNPQGVCFTDFNEFLAQLKSRKRKAINKERQAVGHSGISIERHLGETVDAELWNVFYKFYQLTYAKRSGHGGYLPRHFFHQIGKSLGNKIMLVTATLNNEVIAAALNFYSGDTLYGRYWGCSQSFEFLHFELCYYQGIEFCIEHSLQRFDAGAQGEHKIQRGFKAVQTHSNHWLANPAFNTAVGSFVEEEAALVRQQIAHSQLESPFKAV
jgi:hypothetical protein